MERLVIDRFYNPFGTPGKLVGFDWWTIERPWLNNQPRVSCVPEGVYQLAWHSPTGVSLPRGWTGTWALVNESLGVAHYEKPGIARSVCLFGHVANYPRNVMGCCGFGLSHVIVNNEMMVTSSLVATEQVLTYIRDNNVTEVEFRQWRP